MRRPIDHQRNSDIGINLERSNAAKGIVEITDELVVGIVSACSSQCRCTMRLSEDRERFRLVLPQRSSSVDLLGPRNTIAYLHILQTVLSANSFQHILLAAFLHLAREKQFIKNEIGFLEVEYYIQLADIAVVFIHLFDVAVNDFEGDELVVGRRAAGDEEKGGIAAIDDLRIWARTR